MSRAIAVAAPHHSAVDAAREVVQAGGNAVEAAVAAAAALTVVYPHQCSLGGDLFGLVRRSDGTVRALNASGRYGSRPIGPLDRMPLKGPLTVTVPGVVAGWQWLLENANGTLALDRVLESATALAADGAPVGPRLSAAIAKATAGDTIDGALRDLLTGPDGKALGVGAILHQPCLAETLRTLTERGLRDYYDGTVGDRLAAAFADLGVPVSRTDLAGYQVVEDEPLTALPGGYRVTTSRPNSQGYLLLTSLLTLDELARRTGNADARTMAHVFAHAEARRQRELADPDSMTVDVDRLLTAASVSADADNLLGEQAARREATSSHSVRPTGDTVAVTAVDADGTAVSLIQSLFHSFGSGLRDPDTGIIFHNRGCFFSADPASANVVAPGKRPAHTLMPVLVEHPSGAVSALGAMGGRAQPQIHTQLVAHLRQGASPQDAVSAPRFVVTSLEAGAPADVVLAESDLGQQALDDLEASGLDVRFTHPRDESLGHAMICTRTPDGRLVAGADPRSDGSTFIGS